MLVWLGLPNLGGELISAARHGDDEAWALYVQLDLAAQSQDLHVDAAVVGLAVAPGRELQELVARQHASGLLGKGSQEAELARRKRNLPTRSIGEAVAGEVEAVTPELQHPLRSFRLLMRRERFGDASEEAGLVGDVDEVPPG